MKYAITALLAICLWSSPGLAGVNSVGNGGGFAEMLALMVDHSLVRHIQTCLSRREVCEVDQEQAAFATALVGALPRLQKLPLRFKPECEEPLVGLKSDAIEIASCTLYQAADSVDPKPKRIDEISSLVLDARVSQFSRRQSEPQVPAVSLSSLFTEFTMTEESYALPLESGRAELHVVVFKKSYSDQTTSLILESPLGAMDLTDQLLGLLCPQGPSGPIKTWRAVFDRSTHRDSRHLLFEGDVSWECTGGSFRARIGLAASLGADQEVIPESVAIRLRQKESTGF